MDEQSVWGGDPLPRFILLYAFMYAAFGVASPFWPRFFEARGIAPEELGLMLGLGTAVRLVSGPLAGRIADRLAARRAVLAVCIGLSALVALALLPAQGFGILLLVSLCQAAALAPVTTLADALASRRAAGSGTGSAGRFEYGWVRGAGSAAFVAGTLFAGQVVGAAGLSSIVLLHAGLLLGAVLVAVLPMRMAAGREAAAAESAASRAGFMELLRIASFRRMLVVAALILGSHAMQDAFAVIRWHAAGIGPGLISLLWSLSVAAEVVVFFLLGPPLVARTGPAGAAAIAAAAGVLRWTVMALSAAPLALALAQPLHGLTFALLHLGCMRLLTRTVPAQLAATGQATYAVAAASATALLTIAAGVFYERFGPVSFFAMAVLCAAALPLTPGLRLPVRQRSEAARSSGIR